MSLIVAFAMTGCVVVGVVATLAYLGYAS